MRWWRFKKFDQISSDEQVELQQTEHLLRGTAQLGFEFQVSQDEIDTQGDPDLGQDRVAGGSQEGFDFQVCLDPLEKLLDLPTLFVDVGGR